MSDEEKKAAQEKDRPEESTAANNAKPANEETTEVEKEEKDATAQEETAVAPDATEAPSEEKESKTAAIPEVEEDAKAEELKNADIEPGMLVRVHERIVETNTRGEQKQRTQIFEGLVIGVKGSGSSRTMTVRKNSKGWMVEKIFPLSSPNVEKVEVVKAFRTRRAKLSYLRGRFKRKMKELKTETK